MSSSSPYPRDRFTGSRELEPDRLSNLKSNHEETDIEVSMKKLSEFNESLRRQQQSTSTKFQWNRILSDNSKKAADAALTAAVTKPEPTMSNFITAQSTYPMSSTCIFGSTQENHRFIGSTPLHSKEVKPGFIDNGGEGFRYPEILNEGMMGHAVGFGEKIGSPALSQMAMDRIRRTEEETSSSAVVQMAMDRIRKTEEVTALAHWKMERARARASPIASIVDKIDGVEESAALELERRSSLPQTQYMSKQMGEALNGVMHQQRSGALFHGETRRLPSLYPDANENRNASHSQNEEVFIGERQQFDEHHAHFSQESRNEIPDIEYGGQRCSESRVREQINDVFVSRTNRSHGEKALHWEGEMLELSADYGLSSVQQHHLDLNVEPDDTQQENQLLGLNETPSHGEKRKMQEIFSQSLPHHPSGLNGGSDVMEQETEALESRVCYIQDKSEAHFHGESQHLQRQQQCALKIYPLPNDERSTQHISTIEDGGMNSRDVMEHPKRRIIDLRKIRESRVSTLTRTSDASNVEIPGSEYGGQRWSNEDSSLTRNFTDSDYQMSSRMQEFPQPTNRKSIKQRLRQPFPVNNPNPLPRKSIKQRLGPPSQVDQNRKSIKQRLGRPYGLHNPIDMPWIERHKLGKRAKENEKEFDKRVQARDVSHLVKRGGDDPHEDSDEFKQLIHGTYVKFVKVLNENPAQRRKYEVEAEAVKCCVCGSESKDYVTQSLVTHAFTLRKRRVEHLGLHKALCLLMGWESMTVSKGLWTPKSLPVAEALAMKEDLVIWPPVVILHNSSIGTNSDDRVIVSIKDHEAFLRDAGFGEGISKVCRGKPANLSIIVVIFKETISGLREAEKLHNFYAKNKRGRAEFQQVNCTGGRIQRGPLHKVKHVLYGYLGIAGDLDKLDFETKGHSIIKSKKKIYDLADARRDRDSKERYKVNDGS